MKIIDVPDEYSFQRALAAVLVDGFTTSGVQPWLTPEDAFDEVRESMGADRISRAALGDDDLVLGWIAGFHAYSLVWELHPLVVASDAQNRGVGRALVEDFERQVAARGGVTIMLGTDDENERTSLGGVELYPDPLERLAAIADRGRHPFGFYRKMGYAVSGVIPDANGFGKPDILMCKRVSKS